MAELTKTPKMAFLSAGFLVKVLYLYSVLSTSYRLEKIVVIFLFMWASVRGQTSEIKLRFEVGELNMTFPSIYFKHNSTEYAEMPYTVDSCFKHIAAKIKDVTGKPIWKDSAETDHLTEERIKKIKSDLSKYTSSKLAISSVKSEQKLSRRTINLGVDSAQIQYLLSLNSVFDIAKTRFPKKARQYTHGLWLFGTCFKCIITNPFRTGSWLSKNGREHCRMERRNSKRKTAKN